MSETIAIEARRLADRLSRQLSSRFFASLGRSTIPSRLTSRAFLSYIADLTQQELVSLSAIGMLCGSNVHCFMPAPAGLCAVARLK
jgi:hypothetical protein